jgi:hypothetical protein
MAAFEGQSYNYMQFRTARRRGVEVGSITINARRASGIEFFLLALRSAQ